MDFLKRFKESPTYLAMLARTEFAPSFAVQLEHWWLRDRASGWCEYRWRKHQRPYGRRVSAGAQTVSFELSSSVEVLAFWLYAARGFRANQTEREAQ